MLPPPPETSPHLQNPVNCRLFPRLTEWPPLREEKTANYIDVTGILLDNSRVFFFSVLSCQFLEAPCVPPRQHIWTLRDPEQALSQQQHPPLSRRQTSGGQTPLPCNSPRSVSLALWMPSLFCLRLVPSHTSGSSLSFSRSPWRPAKPKYYTSSMWWSEVKTINGLKYLRCGRLWCLFSPRGDLLHLRSIL